MKPTREDILNIFQKSVLEIQNSVDFIKLWTQLVSVRARIEETIGVIRLEMDKRRGLYLQENRQLSDTKLEAVLTAEDLTYSKLKQDLVELESLRVLVTSLLEGLRLYKDLLITEWRGV